MAIQTGGYGIDTSVLPQLGGVTKEMAGWDPTQVLKGFNEGVGAVRNLAELQAFNQHAKEVAATEATRTQLLQAQLKQHDLMNQLNELTLGSRKKTEPATTAETIAKAEAGTLVAPKVAAADIAKAESDVRKGEIEAATFKSDLANAKWASHRKLTDMRNAAIKADLDIDDYLEHHQEDKFDERQYAKLRNIATRAKADLEAAQAASLTDTNNPTTKRTAALRQLADEMTKLTNTKVPDPRVEVNPDDPEQVIPMITLDQYRLLTRDNAGKPREATTVERTFLPNKTIPAPTLNPNAEAMLEQLDNARVSYNELRGAKTQTAKAAPKKGTVVQGYIFLGGDPADKKNWKKQ